MNTSTVQKKAGPGSLDLLFGNRGKVIYSMPSGDFFGSVQLLPDGKLLGVGYVSEQGHVVMVRFHSDGQLDTDFGEGGVVSTAVIGAAILNLRFALLPNGSIIIGGSFKVDDFTHQLFFAQLSPEGLLNTRFGRKGLTIINLTRGHNSLHSMTLQPDGKIVATAREEYSLEDYTEMVLRLTADGALDSTFGHAGIVKARWLSSFYAAVRIQQDGKILTGGAASPKRLLLARYNSNGSSDETFGKEGFAFFDLPDEWTYNQFNDLVLQADQKIVATGGINFSSKALLMRVTPEGAIDKSFNNGEPIISSVGHLGNVDLAVALQSDGKIVSLGATTGRADCTLMRFHPDGRPDTEFGDGGVVVTDFEDGMDVFTGLQIQAPDDRIIISGQTLGDRFALGIARYFSR